MSLDAVPASSNMPLPEKAYSTLIFEKQKTESRYKKKLKTESRFHLHKILDSVRLSYCPYASNEKIEQIRADTDIPIRRTLIKAESHILFLFIEDSISALCTR